MWIIYTSKTSGRLKVNDLTVNKQGKVVSLAKSKLAKKQSNLSELPVSTKPKKGKKH